MSYETEFSNDLLLEEILKKDKKNDEVDLNE